jgi:hypothetical protein
MLTSGIRFLPPRTLGQRTFMALVRESDFSHDLGSLVMVQPLALIVEEEGNWSFFPLEDGITPAILDTVVPAGDPKGDSPAR